jgi:hypothetical protein
LRWHSALALGAGLAPARQTAGPDDGLRPAQRWGALTRPQCPHSAKMLAANRCATNSFVAPPSARMFDASPSGYRPIARFVLKASATCRVRPVQQRAGRVRPGTVNARTGTERTRRAGIGTTRPQAFRRMAIPDSGADLDTVSRPASWPGRVRGLKSVNVARSGVRQRSRPYSLSTPISKIAAGGVPSACRTNDACT